MSSDDAARWQDQPPRDDVPEPPADTDDAFSEDPWGEDLTDAFADPAGPNLFSAEIENVNASDWDLDAAGIWDDADQTGAQDSGSTDLDFPL